ncbi:two-component sensor histidine kinase [Paracoccus suum]|uniref:histidine kinase n=1 Tax=Paracoccus suum TaxID=2259340 RepID=A0A344PGY1_9RHOB|nr:histidine kinase dimerization/phospho-acceptor domain-containing protein [Paracoccus suum]AXC48636.1 two-component sensor histidine kinase [Paracoccus suum]
MTRTPPRSLTRDLTLGFGCGLVAVWLAALAIGWAVLGVEIDEIYDAALTRTSERLAVIGAGAGAAGLGDRRPAGALRARLTATDGQTVYAVGELPAETPIGFSRVDGLRVLTQRLPDGGLLQVADPLAERREAVRETLLSALVPFALLLPLAIFGLWRFVRRQLAPVNALSREVADRGAADLRPLSAAPLPVELQPMHDAVDRLMGRLDEALAAERAFSSNAAHELRTPIAAALAQAEMLEAEATDPRLARRASTLAAQLRRVGRLAGKLLELARAEGGAASGPKAAPQDVRQALQLVAAEFPTTELALPEKPHLLAVDLDAFAVIARNLIENAVLHGTDPITVVLAGDTLTVCNGGQVLDPTLLNQLTRRFQRGASRASGSGLGLAIVEGHALREGAALTLASPAPGRGDGFCATVRFRT